MNDDVLTRTQSYHPNLSPDARKSRKISQPMATGTSKKLNENRGLQRLANSCNLPGAFFSAVLYQLSYLATRMVGAKWPLCLSHALRSVKVAGSHLGAGLTHRLSLDVSGGRLQQRGHFLLHMRQLIQSQVWIG